MSIRPFLQRTGIHLALAAVLLTSTSASIIEQATESLGTFNAQLAGGGTVTTVGSPTRTGSVSLRSSLTATTGSRRAEIDDGQFGFYAGSTFWYAFSYFLPDDGTWEGDFQQFTGQLRFSNLTQSGFSVPNASMNSAFGNIFHGGSGHHLTVDKGAWRLLLAYQDPSVGSALGMLTKGIQLPAITTGVWSDFIYHACWSSGADGFIRVWLQTNGRGYRKVGEYYGPTWFDTYAEGSGLAG
jgi:Polysaccharide lyase